MISYNQAGQEEWVRSYLKDKRAGYFVDVGAYDGIESSNTFFLEKELGWEGLCIESNPEYYNKLIYTRGVKCVNKACMPFRGHATYKGIETFQSEHPGNSTVESETLDTLLLTASAPKDIDYISMDIEGHELSIIESFPFCKWNVNLFTIEHNLYLIGDVYKTKIYDIMSANGYDRVVENVMCPTGPYEDWYAKR